MQSLQSVILAVFRELGTQVRICGNAAGEHDGLSAGTPHSLTHSTDKPMR